MLLGDWWLHIFFLVVIPGFAFSNTSMYIIVWLALYYLDILWQLWLWCNNFLELCAERHLSLHDGLVGASSMVASYGSLEYLNEVAFLEHKYFVLLIDK
jgi:hypothetical protein